MTEDKARKIGYTISFLLLILVFYMMFQLKPEHHIYEVHGADGTVYHTTNLHYGRNDIWFTDENGNAVILGGGYTVIRKQ